MVQKGLQWLEANSKAIQSPGSLSLAVIALNAYGRASAEPAQALRAMYEEREILWNVPEVAWASLALGRVPGWLKRKA